MKEICKGGGELLRIWQSWGARGCSGRVGSGEVRISQIRGGKATWGRMCWWWLMLETCLQGDSGGEQPATWGDYPGGHLGENGESVLISASFLGWAASEAYWGEGGLP